MGKRGPKPGERVPYGFTDWNSPLAQREIWGAPKLYEWQEKILRYFSENLHVHAVMSTPNESGKTQVVVPMLGLAAMAAFPGCTVYSTAGAEAQIKLQLFEYLKSYCKPFENEGWVVNQSQLTVTAPSVEGMPSSRWVGRVPRDALTAEGFHETWERDDKGRLRFRPLLMIADEAKSLESPVFEMMMRLRPTWILALSTPDTNSGPFYSAISPEDVEARGIERRGFKYIEDSRGYWGLKLMVSSAGCAHLLTEEKLKESEAVKMSVGESHKLYRSMVLGKFTAGDEDYSLYGMRDIEAVIKAMNRRSTPEMMIGESHAGFDVSSTGDGDPKILYVVKNKVVLPAYVSTEDDNVKVAEWAVNILREHNVEPRNCRVDNGGAGKVTVDIMEGVFNYRGIFRYNNNATAKFTADFYDSMTEDSFAVRELFHQVDLILPRDDRLLEDMKGRRVVEMGDHKKIKLQPKKLHRKDNSGKSPDRLDAFTMALAGRCLHGLSRYAPSVKRKDEEYNERKMRGRHFAEKKLQDENARRGPFFGMKSPSLMDIRRGK